MTVSLDNAEYLKKSFISDLKSALEYAKNNTEEIKSFNK